MEKKKPQKFLHHILLYPIAIILLFEEWGWVPLAALFDRLKKLPFWETIERKIMSLSPKFVLFVFGIPFLLLLPIKFLAIFLFGKGHIVSGSLVLVSSKVIGTAICARLFQLTKPALFKIKWFSHWYPRWKNWKDGILKMLKESSSWHILQKMKLKIKMWWLRMKKLYFRVN
jgi:hypothetical protein